MLLFYEIFSFSKCTVQLLLLNIFILMPECSFATLLEDRSNHQSSRKEKLNHKQPTKRRVRFELPACQQKTYYRLDQFHNAEVIIPLRLKYCYSGKDYHYVFSYTYKSPVWQLSKSSGRHLFIRSLCEKDIISYLKRNSSSRMIRHLHAWDDSWQFFGDLNRLVVEITVSTSYGSYIEYWFYNNTVSGSRQSSSNLREWREHSTLFHILQPDVVTRHNGVETNYEVLSAKQLKRCYRQLKKERRARGLARLHRYFPAPSLPREKSIL